MKNKKLLYLLLGISLLSLIGQALIYPQLPETIATHFDSQGNANGYGPKTTIFLLGLLPPALCLLFWFLPKIDPKYQNYSKHEKVYSLMAVLTTLFMILINWVMVFKAMDAPLPVEYLVPCLIGILFIILGNFLPRVRPNYFLGIRTPWALDNEFVWKKTHKFGGIIFCAMGAVMILFPLLPFSSGLTTQITAAVVLAASLSTYLYSYLVYRKYVKKQ